MKRIAISIVLNGAHHIHDQLGTILPHFDQWIVVEGASKNVFCTSWCSQVPDEYHNNGNSIDDTMKILDEIVSHNDMRRCQVTVLKASGLWEGKLTMFNEAIKCIQEPCWLWEIDIDEYWRPEQLGHSEAILEHLKADIGTFACDYMLSENIIVRGEWGESITHGYRRLWKYEPGRKFISHEPPIIEGMKTICPTKLLPRFRHLSYFYEKDVLFKSKWYGDHENIHTGWKNIVTGVTQLPCAIEHLFMKTVTQAWKNTIITYR